MINRIWINGNSSQDVDGLLIQELPPITKPQIRTMVETIDGRDGDVITKLGYSSYTKTAKIGLYGTYDIDKVIEFFNQEGIVVFSNEADKYYNFSIYEQIDFERLLRFRQAEVKFHVQPFKFDMVDRRMHLELDLLKFIEGQIEKYGITIEVESEKQIRVSGTTTLNCGIYVPIKPIPTDGEYILIAKRQGSSDGAYMSLVAKSYMQGFGTEIALEYDEGIMTAETNETFDYIYLRFDAGSTVDFTLSAYFTAGGDNRKAKVYNRGNYISVPRITLIGEGDMSLYMHGEKVCDISLGDSPAIVIDGANMNAYFMDELLNRKIECDFKEWYLPIGFSDIAWEGRVLEMYIDDYSRWI